MATLREEFEKDIYRPGEDLSGLVDLTDEEMSERRKEIEEIFNGNGRDN